MAKSITPSPKDQKKKKKEKEPDYAAILVQKHGNWTAAAESLGITRNAMKWRHAKQRRVPFCELDGKKKIGTPEQVISDLRTVVEAYPDKVISRNFYRVNGTYAESAWNCHFGTFTEFKRQAQITHTRHQHMLEKHIAKHVAADHYREIRSQIEGYESKYTVRDKSRFVKMAMIFDLHDVDIDPFYLRVLLDTLKRFMPSIVCFGGDLFDLPEFSRWTQDPRTWDAPGRIQFAWDMILGPVRTIVGDDCLIDLIEGNHELRMLRQLADATPALRAVLSDLHGYTIPQLLGLDRFRINYIARADLASTAWRQMDIKKELRRNFKVYHECLLVHHYPDGAKQGIPGFNGHHHKHVVTPHYSSLFGAYEWVQSGTGHRRDADYTEGEKWNCGFPLVIIDTLKKRYITEYVTIGEEIAMSGGKVYYRKKEEEVL